VVLHLPGISDPLQLKKQCANRFTHDCLLMEIASASLISN
jgi:hypothetical protein